MCLIAAAWQHHPRYRLALIANRDEFHARPTAPAGPDPEAPDVYGGRDLQALTKSFGSQIRGGESSCRLRIATRPIYSTGGTLDVAVVLNWEDFLKFGAELPVGGHTVVIYESKTGVQPDRLPLPGVRPAASLPVPIGDMAKSMTGTDRAKNTVVLGLLAGWFGITREGILAGIRKRLEKKGAEVVEANQRAFDAGVEYVEQHPLASARTMASPAEGKQVKLLVDGNEMCAYIVPSNAV